MLTVQQGRPPFVEFYIATQHDPIASVEKGYRVTKEKEMVRIVPMGSKDDILKPAKEWLDGIKKKYLENAHDAFPEEWVSGFHRKYELWKEGKEAPLTGTSVREWPVLSPAQAENFIAIRLLTIEDVADMNEEAMRMYGMGARELREKAIEWIRGKEIAQKAISENEDLKKRIAQLEDMVKSLSGGEPKRRGRPPKTELKVA